MKAIRVSEYGGPEVLKYEETNVPQPGSGEALINLKAAGINFIDIYHRSGLYKGALPFTPGMEGAGIIEAVGADVSDFKPGDKVAYAQKQGSYAEYAVVPVGQLVPVPEGLDFPQAAAALLQGMTAHYLCYSTYPLKAGEIALIHAGAGGVGLILTQMCHKLGATVITTVSTEEKAALSREAGANEVILYTQEDFEARVKELTGGKGVEVVYDGVGKTTFDKSLNVLKPRGYLALFGASSGPVPPVDPLVLMGKGSIFLTRPTMFNYVLNRQELLWRAGDVLGWIASGELKLRLEHTYPLAEAAQAHTDLAGRNTTGKLVLIP